MFDNVVHFSQRELVNYYLRDIVGKSVSVTNDKVYTVTDVKSYFDPRDMRARIMYDCTDDNGFPAGQYIITLRSDFQTIDAIDWYPVDISAEFEIHIYPDNSFDTTPVSDFLDGIEVIGD